MLTQRQILIGIVALCLLLLSGCGEVLNEYYISNHTDAALTVRFTPRYVEMVALSSGPLIEEIEQSARTSLEQPVHFDQDGETIQFTIPAKTSVFLGYSSGGNDLFSQLDVSNDTIQLVMDSNDYREHFAVHDHFFGAIVHILNVK
ncbi:MAG: hypothetical protein KDJ65_11065 [Anaerolineae bacterium]|nr:hypothetical protein [Anaerolineae bacterium]